MFSKIRSKLSELKRDRPVVFWILIIILAFISWIIVIIVVFVIVLVGIYLFIRRVFSRTGDLQPPRFGRQYQPL